MGIETRKGRQYLYRRKRVNGRLRGVYLYPLCPLSEERFRTKQARQRQQKAQARQAVESAVKGAAEILAAGAEFDRLADRVFRAVMYLTGHTLHKRSEWRRKRGVTAMAKVDELFRSQKKPAPALVTLAHTDPDAQRLLARAATGDSSVLPAVKKLLTDPCLLTGFGSVSGWAWRALIRVAAGDDLAASEAVQAKHAEYTQKLLADGGPNPPFAEQMAVTRVAHNWLLVHILEIKLTSWDAGSAEAAAIDKHLCRAERRLQASLKSLAVLRRLRVPMVVNQVNIAKGGPMVVNNGVPEEQ